MAGRGRRMTFHGAFGSKARAKRKERQVGGFIRRYRIKGHARWVVMKSRTGKRNPRITGRIPGRVARVIYDRSPGKRYYHAFKPGVRQYTLSDGSVLLRGNRPIHADDREPGFWSRHGHSNARRRGMARRRRRRRQRAGGNWGWLLGLGALVFFLAPGGSAFARPGGPAGTGQEPIGWWFNPSTGDLVWSWGVTPPGSGYRPASQTELATYGQGMM